METALSRRVRFRRALQLSSGRCIPLGAEAEVLAVANPDGRSRVRWCEWDGEVHVTVEVTVDADLLEGVAEIARNTPVHTYLNCPHGNRLGECHACDVAGDLAFDATREDRGR